MRFSELMRDLPGVRLAGAPGDPEISGIRYDSRWVRKGDLFCGMPGVRTDGSAFAPQAVEQGAAAVLASRELPLPVPCAVAEDPRRAMALAAHRFHGDPTRSLTLVGITGTNGKTTTSYLVRSILETAGLPTGMVGTVQYLVGGQVLAASRTTPESVDLAAMLAGMVSSGDRACVMEVSSHALALRRVDGCRMEAAVFTNLTQDHLDFHETMEGYFAAKSLLFTEHEVRTKIVNRDDPYGRRLLDELPAAISFGVEGGAVRPAAEVSWGAWGTRFTALTPWGEVAVESPLAGLFNVSNILAAIAAAGAVGIPLRHIEEGLARMEKVPGRFEKVDRGQDFTALVDYAHTPDALEKLLENARRMTRHRLVVVFGCGGDRDRGKRPLMGAVAGRLADVVFVTSDNPRGEDPEAIIAEVLAGMAGAAAAVRRVPDRREAIYAAVAETGEGDVLAVAGKGHENYQEAKGHTTPFSDVDELASAIERAGRSSR